MNFTLESHSVERSPEVNQFHLPMTLNVVNRDFGKAAIPEVLFVAARSWSTMLLLELTLRMRHLRFGGLTNLS